MMSIICELVFCIVNAFCAVYPDFVWWYRGISLLLAVLLGAMATVDIWAKSKGMD